MLRCVVLGVIEVRTRVPEVQRLVFEAAVVESGENGLLAYVPLNFKDIIENLDSE